MVTTPVRRPSALAPALAGTWSALAAVLGLWWLLRPDRFPFGKGVGAATVLDSLSPTLVGAVLVASGLVGAAVAVAARRVAPAVVVAVAAVHVAVFGLLVPGVSPLALTGYLMAMFGPPVLFLTLLAGAWRWRGGPVAVGVFVLLALLAWVTGIADGDVLARYVTVVGGSLGRVVTPVYLTFSLLGGLAWGLLGFRTWQRSRAGRPAPAWTRTGAAARWGRIATAVAVACALPYGLHRFTWLTPWPVGVDRAELAASPEIRLHGFLLGMAALAGAVLTSGLVARWGEVWPRWVPVLRGRPVPVAAAVVPGTLVAALFTVAAVPLTAQSVADGRWLMMLVLPFPVWGPALGAAVLAYALRRRGTPRGLAQSKGHDNPSPGVRRAPACHPAPSPRRPRPRRAPGRGR